MKEIIIDNKNISITHAEKILFPRDKITKMDLINYYIKIADYILPFLKNRPLTINCFSSGIDEPGFYRQHTASFFPEWFGTFKLERKMGGTINHILCQDKASLIYLINQNTITLHRWMSTITNPENPSIFVIDIDPPLGQFATASRAAKLIKKALEGLGYSCQSMTTGSRGLHVIGKIEEICSYEKIRGMLRELTSHIAYNHPDLFSVDIRKSYRENLVYLDISRNAYGQTGVAPFSVRAKDTAPIATPISWEELDDPSLNSTKYNIHNIFKKLDNLKSKFWII